MTKQAIKLVFFFFFEITLENGFEVASLQEHQS